MTTRRAQTLRQKFEAWLKREYPAERWETTPIEYFDGQYTDESVNDDWLAYRAGYKAGRRK